MDTSKFAELGLNEQICAGVEALGFTDPTPVQEQAIPLVLAGRDVVASAQTGTGKTAAFALPVLQVIAPYSCAARAAHASTVAKDQNIGVETASQVAGTGAADAKGAGAADLGPKDAEATDAGAVDAKVAGTGAADAKGADAEAASVAGAGPEVARILEAGDDVPGEGSAGGADVLEDAMPTEPHLSEPLLGAGSETEASGDAASAVIAPKRPRRRHHKKAVALSEQLTSDKVVPDGSSESSDAINDKAAGASNGEGHKKKARKRHAKKPKVVEVDRDVLMLGEKAAVEAAESKSQAPGVVAVAGTEVPDPQRADGSLSSESDASTGTKVAGAKSEKPKRKRRKKHAKKKKGGLAAEIAATEDPSAHPFGPFALVVTPTRELAQQIDNVVSTVCEHTGQRAVIVMGGAKFERQIRELQKGCDMLVATPGRLIDLMDHNHVDLSQVKVLVLDEADRMLDMGFWPSVRRIVSALPKDRQTLLFSATIPPSIKGTVDAMLHDPAKVEIARIGETADTVEEHLCPVTQGQKIELLEALINRFDPERVLVFCRTKHRVDDVSTYLAKSGLSVDVMHSDRSQKDRERALAKFRAGKCKVLVATDVMSRGIDVSGIDAVVNFDVPMDPEDYVHRIGRTGRAGHAGLAFTFVAPDEISPLREIEYFTKKLIPVWDLEGFEYDSARIVPNPDRSTKRVSRTMFNGARSRGRGIGAGRYGRHY